LVSAVLIETPSPGKVAVGFVTAHELAASTEPR
jgi:hypothetical protein